MTNYAAFEFQFWNNNGITSAVPNTLETKLRYISKQELANLKINKQLWTDG